MLAAMTIRKLEIWIDKNGLPGLCFSGPDGDGFRYDLEQPALLAHEFTAGCHIEAMEIYHKYVGYEKYKSDYPELDSIPYK